MVRGIEQFRLWFQDYQDSYLIIGGTACDAVLSEAGFSPRATKDFDIILIVEALTADFVARFWDFVKTAGYRKSEQEQEKRNAYRFSNPTDPSFPIQVELFCRKPDAIAAPPDIHLTPIPTDEGLSSLSAILLNDDYYRFTLQHCWYKEGIHFADTVALICLKAYAYLSNKTLRNDGANISSVNINKHKNDVFRLLPLLPAENRIELPPAIQSDMRQFIEEIKDELPSKQLLKDAGFPNTLPEKLYKNLISNIL